MGLWLALLVVVSFPGVKAWIGKEVAATLCKTLGTRVDMGSVTLNLFNSVSIEDLTIYDQANKQMLRVNRIDGAIDLWALLGNKVRITNLKLIKGNGIFYRQTSKDKPNYQFVIDSLAPKPDKQGGLEVSLYAMATRDLQIKYDVLDAPQSDGLVDFNHIDITRLNSSIVLHDLTEEKLNIRIRDVKMNMRNGLSIEGLRASVATHDKGNTLQLDIKQLLAASKQHEAKLRLSDSQFIIAPNELNTPLRAIINAKANGNLEVPGHNFNATIAYNNTSKQQRPLHAKVNLADNGKNILNADIKSEYDFKESMGGTVNINVDKNTISNLATLFHFQLPNNPIVTTLNNISQTADFDYQLGKLVFKGTTKTDILDADEELTLNASNADYDFSIRHLNIPTAIGGLSHLQLDNANLRGSINLGTLPLRELLNLSFSQLQNNLNATIAARIDNMVVNEYNVSNLDLKADYKPDNLYANLNLNDPKASLSTEGTLKNLNTGDLTAHVNLKHFDYSLLNKLGINLEQNVIGEFDIQADNILSIPQNFNITARNTTIQDPGKGNFYIDYANIACKTNNLHHTYSINAPGINGDLTTNANISEIPTLFTNILSAYMPVLTKDISTTPAQYGDCKFTFTVSESPLLSHFTKSDIILTQPIHIDGDVSKNNVQLSLAAPKLNIANEDYTNTQVNVHSLNDSLFINLATQRILSNMPASIFNSLVCHNNDIVSESFLTNADNNKTIATIKTQTQLQRTEEGKICANINLLPTDLYIADSAWTITNSNIYLSQNNINISNFNLHRNNQYININADFNNENPEKRLLVELNDIEVKHILNMVNFDAVDFYGKASGTITGNNILTTPEIAANLVVNNFYFNTGAMGTLRLKGQWDNEHKRVYMDANTTRSQEDSTFIKGYIDVDDETLDIRINSHNTNLQFLNKYLGSFISDLEGNLSGKFRLFGTLKDVNMEGNECINFLKFRPNMLGVMYNFENDSIHLRRDTIDMTGMTLRDPYGNYAKIRGGVFHTDLRRINYDITALPHELLLLNWEEAPSKAFWGTVFTDGSINIHGDTKDVTLSGALRTSGQPGSTTLYYNSDPVPTGDGNYEYIHFVTNKEKHPDSAPDNATKDIKDNSGEIKINFVLETEPNATLNIITDPKTKDYMSLNGTGPLSLAYYNKGDFLINGSYNVTGGKYKLTIKDIIKKEFSIQNGGYLRFNGKPSEGDILLKGIHNIRSVSLSDLNLGATQNNSTIGVNCILNFSGKTSDPKVDFDIEYPSANTDQSKLINNLLLTKEDRDMQAIYLLSIGRFYTYNYNTFSQAAGGQSQSAIAMSSFLAGTLSGQINTVLQDAFHVTNWNFDTNIAAGRMGFNDMEVQGSITGNLFNNRLLLNGNIGYRDQTTTYNNNFVGDFNARWLLNKSGTISLKAYSETNDRYFTKSSLLTQGSGLIFQKDFNKLREFLKKK